MSWVYLFIAALFEIGWPIGLKMSDISSYRIGWIAVAVCAMILSGVFLYFAQKTIPIGTAYAVWTGIGAAGTFLAGILLFHDAFTLGRGLGVLLVIAGVVVLKFGH